MKENNISLGMKHRAEQGYLIREAPFGYTRISQGRTKYRHNSAIFVNEEEAKKVLEIFEKYTSGKYSMRSLAENMTAQGGKKYHNTTIERILNNRFYVGFQVLNGVEYKHAYPAIITEEMYQKARAIRPLNTKYKLAGDI